MLYNTALVSAIQQHESAIGIHKSLPLEFLSHLPPVPTALDGHRALGLSAVSCSKFPLVVHFTDGNVYVSVLVSPFNPPSPSSTVSTKQLVFKNRLIGAVISDTADMVLLCQTWSIISRC